MADRRPVRRLPEHLVNQIAAGEVVERPASVLKELLENALDAGARRVRVQLEEGGCGAVAVQDDGSGMAGDDLALSLERHATSKIQTLDDLGSVATFGFRGEALPSIASVSQFSIVSRPGEAGEALEIRQDGERREGPVPASHPPGTTVTVRRLFHRVPGRRKFLRAAATELRHCVDVLQMAALLHPGVAFHVTHDGRVLLDLAAQAGHPERIADLFGDRFRDTLIAAEGSAACGHLRAWLGPTHLVFPSRDRICLFVNGRPVQDRLLGAAALEAYRASQPRGKFPAIFLFLDVPPGNLDVNVHPAKREVRFRDGQQVFRFVADTLAAALKGGAEQAVPVGTRIIEAGERHQARIAEAEARFLAGVDTGPPAGKAGPAHGPAAPARSAEALRIPEAGAGGCTGSQPVRHGQAPRRLLGQLWNTFLLVQDADGLLLLDQHVAHERVLFERMRAAWDKREATPRRALLFPLVLEVSRAELAQLEKGAEVLEIGGGVALEAFGDRQVRVTAVPAYVPEKRTEDYVREMLADLAREGASGVRSASSAVERILASAACRSAVMANEPLTPEEQERLVQDALSGTGPATCPHGRPMFLRVSPEDILRFFRRI